MSSSIALSAAAASRPGVARPALSQLVSTKGAQSRSIYRAARNGQCKTEKSEHTSRPLNKSHCSPHASTRSGSCFSGGFASHVESIHGMERFDGSLPGFLRSFINAESPLKFGTPLKSHLQDFNFTQSPEFSRDGLRYDPVSGRMVPYSPQPSKLGNQKVQDNPAIDCAPGNELEAKFASSPFMAEETQFQPGASVEQEIGKTCLNPQPIDWSAGNELDALFTSHPASYKEIRAIIGAFHESAHKPNINIGCPPGNELEALFISESVHSGKPHAETSRPSRHLKKLSEDSGLKSGKSVECSPGSELETLLTSKPILRADKTTLVETYEASPLAEPQNIVVDCPPGHELEAKFASTTPEPVSQATQSNLAANTIDCSPGNEVEAKIASEAAATVNKETIDCPPGNELETKFTADPVPSTEDGQFQPSLIADELYTQRANITLECQPGNELESMFISKAASGSPSLSDDLKSLTASDIRARYASLPTEPSTKPDHSKNIEYSSSEDHIGEYILKTQNTSTPSAQQDSSPAYRILTYDSVISQVTTAESDSFFGVNETTPLAEVLSRLQNPARFVPYFDQMQRDGYEIATGGGDILVFRKLGKSAAEQDSPVHADVAKFLRHDAYPVSTNAGSSRPSSTNQPPSANRSSIEGSSSNSGSSSSTGKTLRRIILTGTATAASCYAIGVVVEYFRSGGKDGWGIDAFTVFESDRLHRE
ncbi:hypothetical protein N7478_008656 [Penicillium angulare]|uniref:uncharacterized protein n=1 Tax=Penicillium angulare TaxID=116970 RepID=UPI0025416D12|nr:uncharacterized protein N7478_008656 [Penicillium angulare]KAJ5273531.1 hypothetical protein N7478_008656 [Penicillium angulare]